MSFHRQKNMTRNRNPRIDDASENYKDSLMIDEKAKKNNWTEEKKQGYSAGYSACKARMKSEMAKALAEKETELRELWRIYPFNLISNLLDENPEAEGIELNVFSPYLIRKTMINTLTEMELRVIELRYGQNFTLEKAGERFGITRERVRQIEAKAFYKLKRNLGKMMAVSYEEYSLACQEKEEAVKKLKALETRTQLSDSLPEQPEKAEIPIEDLDLSARAYNALRRADVKTVGEITKKFEDGTIVQCRNLGLTSIKEICKKLTSIGVSVKYI